MLSPSRKVLVITYYFPPSGGAGVQRTLKFIKYLRDFGWEPVVLTARDADYPAYDASLCAEVPLGVNVYRARIFEPYRIYRKVTRRPAGEAIDIATLSLDDAQKRRAGERMAEFIRSAFFVPDARIGWLPGAYRLAKDIVATENIAVILSSAPPYTTHLIARKLKKFSGLPWVADFRDSWIGWVSAPQWRPWLSRRLELRMEAEVLRTADRILHVSQGVKKDLLSRHPQLQDDRWRFLPNGYDVADFEHIEPNMTDNKLVITYVGSLYGPRNPEYLLRALESLHQEAHPVLRKLLFRVVGRVGEPILARIRTSSVSQYFEHIPYLSHRESIAYLLGSDILLLIIDDSPANRGIVTGKLFEYIAAGKTILALAPDGEAAALIRENRLGSVVPFADEDAIKQAILQLTFEKCEPVSAIKQETKARFQRKQLTGELAAILEQVVAPDAS